MALFSSNPLRRKRVKFPRRKRSFFTDRFWKLVFILALMVVGSFIFKAFNKDSPKNTETVVLDTVSREKTLGEKKEKSPEIRLAPAKKADTPRKAPSPQNESPSLLDDPRINLAGITNPDFNPEASPQGRKEITNPTIAPAQLENKPQVAEEKKLENTSPALLKPKNGLDNPWGVPFVGYSLKESAEIIGTQYPHLKKGKWINQHEGIYNKIPGHKAGGKDGQLALTVNLHGSDRLDPGLLTFLRGEKIPVAFFATSQWIARNKEDFSDLAKNSLFTVEGHGKRSIPNSVTGLKLEGLKGTASILELLEEVEGNMRDIQRLASRRPQWYRGVFGQYEDTAVDIITRDLNIPIAGFSVYAWGTAQEMADKILKSQDGDIVLAQTSGDGQLLKALENSLPHLKRQGYKFILLPAPKK